MSFSLPTVDHETAAAVARAVSAIRAIPVITPDTAAEAADAVNRALDSAAFVNEAFLAPHGADSDVAYRGPRVCADSVSLADVRFANAVVSEVVSNVTAVTSTPCRPTLDALAHEAKNARWLVGKASCLETYDETARDGLVGKWYQGLSTMETAVPPTEWDARALIVDLARFEDSVRRDAIALASHVVHAIPTESSPDGYDTPPRGGVVVYPHGGVSFF